MNKAHTQKLIEDFPSLYRGCANTPQVSSMFFRFECNDGWFDLIYKLSADIEAAAHKEGLHPNSTAWPEVNQVKEKYGTLRFYFNGGSDVIWELIENAEAKSAKTCESCGLRGKTRDGSWIKTLCDTCANLK